MLQSLADASQCQSLRASTSHSHSIVNKPLLDLSFNNLYFAQLTIPLKIPCSEIPVSI